MKNKEKQEFRSSNVLTLLGLIALSAAVIATPWNRQFQDTRIESARQKAEVVGYQVVQIYRESIKVSLPPDKVVNLRQPASVATENNTPSLRSNGTMGTDPWGQPYHYRLFPGSDVKNTKILVWSSGPNKKMETNNLANEELVLAEQPSYVGDDIGIVLSMSQN